MLRGKCKLCLQIGKLQRSHYLSSAIYQIAGNRGGPVVKTPDIYLGTDKQIRDHVLCPDCEQLFSRNGEDYVIPLLKQDARRFPLLETLREHEPRITGPRFGAAYSSSEIGVDSRRLAYYAASMFWRGAAHVWKTLNGQESHIYLGTEEEEALRSYLHEESDWPLGMVLQVTVCTDLPSQDNVLLPSNWENGVNRGASMLVFGIFFDLVLGVSDASERELSCTTPPKNVIFLHSTEDTTRESLADLESRAKIAGNLKRRS